MIPASSGGLQVEGFVADGILDVVYSRPNKLGAEVNHMTSPQSVPMSRGSNGGDLRLSVTLASYILVSASGALLQGAGNGTKPRLQLFIRQASLLLQLANIS